VGRRIRAVWKEPGRPARIVLCSAQMREAQRLFSGEAALEEGEALWRGERIGFACAVHAYGEEIGMQSWTDARGMRWFGPAIAFATEGGEIAGLSEDAAEAVRRAWEGEWDDEEREGR